MASAVFLYACRPALRIAAVIAGPPDASGHGTHFDTHFQAKRDERMDMNSILRRARANKTPVAPPLNEDAESPSEDAVSQPTGADAHQAPPPDMNDLFRGRRRHTVFNTESTDDQDQEGGP
jgi:hypothetical protein